MNRELLLTNLKNLRNLLEEINNIQDNIDVKYKRFLELKYVITLDQQSSLGRWLSIILSSFTVVMLLIAMALEVNVFNTIVGLVMMGVALSLITSPNRSMLGHIGVFFIFLVSFIINSETLKIILFGTSRETTVFGIAVAVSIGLSVVIIKYFRIFYNKSLIAKVEERERLIDEITELKALHDEKMRVLLEITKTWFPEEFATVEAVDKLIEYIEQYRANTLQEALNLYVEEERFNQLLFQARLNTFINSASAIATHNALNEMANDVASMRSQTQAMVNHYNRHYR